MGIRKFFRGILNRKDYSEFWNELFYSEPSCYADYIAQRATSDKCHSCRYFDGCKEQCLADMKKRLQSISKGFASYGKKKKTKRKSK